MKWKQKWKSRKKKLRTRSAGQRYYWKSQFSKAKLARNLAIVFLGGVLIASLLGGLAFAWYARDLPEPNKIVRREGFSTKILDRKGELLYEIFADKKRTPVELDDVPEHLQLATVAVEDKNFYGHGGFDPQGILRAVYTNLLTSQTVGGSTLTQQLVKNVLLTKEKTLARKVKEFILAVQIESKYNKDEILQMYLNEAPYGGTAWGVTTAANSYFGKEVSELDLVESVVLAGLPQRPSVYSPFGNNPEAYIGRSQHVLRRMREDGYISKEEEASASAALADLEFTEGLTSIKAPHFVLYVKDQLEDMYGETLVAQGGLQVTTTLDYDLQKEAQAIVTEEIEEVAGQGIGNGAAVVVDPKTGEILSMVGSKDFFAEDYDGQVNVTLSKRQPGSAIKPVTYVTAFKKGYTPAQVVMDVPTEFPSGDGNKYVPENYDGTYRGPVQLRFALGSSLNVVAVKLLAMVGIEDMLNTAYEMGFSTLEPTKDNLARFGLAVTLGGGEVKLLDMASAYSAFANGGFRTEPVSILTVEDLEGKVMFEHKQVRGKRVLEAAESFLINHILSDNNARLLTFGSNSYLNMGGRPIAVKTGTTNDKRDNWTVGWGTGAIVAVWVGNNDNSPMKQVASGVTGASPIWRRIMLKALEKYPAEEWEIPGNIEAVLVDTVSGYPEHSGFPARSEYVIKGTLSSPPDQIHTKLKLCKGQDKLATELDIARNEFDEKEFFVFTEDVKIGEIPSWQEGINAWVSQQGDGRYRPPTEYCDTQNEVGVRVETPGDEENFDGNEVPIRVRVTTQGEIDRVEVFVDGKRQEIMVSRPYETTLNLDTGKHTLKVRAKRKDGKEGESGDIRIGVGGVAWDYQEPTPTPKNTPTSKPKPTSEPTVEPTKVPEEDEGDD